MRIGIIGLGAIGGHAAVRLAHGGARVSALARGETLSALRSGPLVLAAPEGPYPTLEAHVRAEPDMERLGPQDILVVAVKYDALAQILPRIAPVLGDETPVIFAMNGLPAWFGEGLPGAIAGPLADFLDPDRVLRRVLPVERWIACAISSGNRTVAPGRVLNTTPALNRMMLGTASGAIPSILDEFVQIARAGQYQAEAVPDIRAHIWSKLLINSAMSAVSTLVERDIRETCENPDCRTLVIELMQEVLSIGKAIGIEIHADPEAMTEPAQVPPHVTSFLQDLLNGKPLELHSGILAVRKISRLVGRESLRLETIAALLELRSPRQGETQAKRSHALLAERPKEDVTA